MATMTFEQRKEKVNELRKAHFHLGFDHRKLHPKRIVSQNEYLELGIRRVQKKSKKNSLRSWIRLISYSILHFITVSKSLYTSQAKESYQDYQTKEQVALSEETKNDLRKHHFTLGFHSVEDPSEYKREYLQKEKVQQNLDQKQMKTFLTKHNHNFGDAKDIYNSTYDTIHSKGYDPQYLSQKLTKDQLQNITDNIRKTNIVIGNQGKQYETQNTATYQPQQIAKSLGRQYELKKTNAVLGTDDPTKKSVHQTTYEGLQPLASVSLPKDQIRDFRASHFELATTKLALPETTTKESFKMAGKDTLNSLQSPCFQKSNFYIDQAMSSEEYNSRYDSTYKKGIGAGVKLENVEYMKGNRDGTFELGSEPVNEKHFTSVARMNYVNYPGYQKVVQDQKKKNDLRSHHYDLGDDKQDWQTNNQEYNRVGPRTTLNAETLKDLKRHHFKTGYQKGDYYLHSWEYGSKQGPPNALDQQNAEDLKQTHFKENDKNHYETSYQVQNSQVILK